MRIACLKYYCCGMPAGALAGMLALPVVSTVPCIFLHFFMDIILIPWPLQEFWPLQVLVAVLQAPLPLQELTPLQCTIVLDMSAEEAKTGAMANALAALIAKATLVAFNLFITFPYFFNPMM